VIILRLLIQVRAFRVSLSLSAAGCDDCEEGDSMRPGKPGGGRVGGGDIRRFSIDIDHSNMLPSDDHGSIIPLCSQRAVTPIALKHMEDAQMELRTTRNDKF